MAESCPALEASDPVVKPALLSIYEKVPSNVRNALCQAPFTLAELSGSAFTTAMGGTIINRAWASRLVETSADRWLTWKEQLNFGIPKTAEFPTDVKLPSYKMTSERRISGIDFLVLHETAHRLHSVWNQSLWLAASNDAFESLQSGPLPCFYECKVEADLIKDSEVLPFYKYIAEKKDILDLYSLVRPEEEFADGYALYILRKYMGVEKLELYFQDVSYDLVKVLMSKEYERKRSVIQELVD
jgi:hypothetical protein